MKTAATAAAATQLTAPLSSPARAPAPATTSPISGPPIGVVPWKAIAQSAMTRPRMEGAALSCRVELPRAMNETLAQPTAASARYSRKSRGAPAARKSTTAKAEAASATGRRPVWPRAAVTSPPATAPIPIEAVMKPYTVAPPWKVCLASTGSTTWNS